MELLVVIAIMSILLNLVLPAVQQARESARRLQCVNNLRQIGLAMQDYHGAHGTLPAGNRSTAYGTWALYILPNLELTNLYNAWDFDGGETISDTNQTTGQSYMAESNRTVVETRIAVYTCPSDIERVNATVRDRWIPHHNYAANYGNSTLNQGKSYTGIEFKGAPFGNVQTDATAPAEKRPNLGRVKFASITDGLANTLLLSELIQGSGYQFKGEGSPPALRPRADLRGRIIGYADGGYFMTMNPPNTPLNDYENSNYCIPPAIPLYEGGLINPENPPCNQSNQFDMVGRASRSHHVGGVNSTYSDGSVRFSTDEVDPALWRALGSTQGEEIEASSPTG